jgi:hypothetical protein
MAANENNLPSSNILSVRNSRIILFYGPRISASVDRSGLAKSCPLEAPIAVQVKNYSFKTIKRVVFSAELFKDGRSVNLLSQPRFTFNYLVKPFKSETLCYSDEYTDSAITSSTPSSIDKDGRLRVSMADVIPQAKSATKFGASHAIYLSAVKFEMLE